MDGAFVEPLWKTSVAVQYSRVATHRLTVVHDDAWWCSQAIPNQCKGSRYRAWFQEINPKLQIAFRRSGAVRCTA